MVGLAELEPSSGHAGVCADADLVGPGAYGTVSVAVAIRCRLSRPVERLDVEIRDVWSIDGVRPGHLLVETEVGKRQPVVACDAFEGEQAAEERRSVSLVGVDEDVAKLPAAERMMRP